MFFVKSVFNNFIKNKIPAKAFSSEFWEIFHLETLTHFCPMLHFYPHPPKKIVRKVFWRFQEVLKWNIWLKWVKNETLSHLFSFEFSNIFKKAHSTISLSQNDQTFDPLPPFFCTCLILFELLFLRWAFITLHEPRPLPHPIQNKCKWY